MSAAKTKIPSALRYLHKFGIDALKPTKIPSVTNLPLSSSSSSATTATIPNNINDMISSYHPINRRQRWSKPKVSKRIANTLRKKAIRNGTYGTYDPNTGIGWDASWDNHNNTTFNTPTTKSSLSFNNENISWMEIRPYKDTKRERTREARAKKIEDLLTTADDKILEYRLAQKEKKPEPGIENLIKKMMRNSRK